jgi:hypothetical protein
MFRPNVTFLDVCDLHSKFESEQKTPVEWDPHMKLEFCKVMIRTKVSEFSLSYKKSNDDKHETLFGELSLLS